MTSATIDLTATILTLPPDAKFLPVSELSPRLRSKIGTVGEGQSVITRPGFRITTRLVPGPLADLVAEFRAPSLVSDAVLRFARAHDQDPAVTLELAFEALATLIESRILVPEGSPDAAAPTPSLAAGQAFASFEIETLIRSLEDSEVYRAWSPDRERVALKIARDGRPHIANMLANEASVLDHLDGVDSPRLVAAGVEGGRTYVAMEWCDGVSITVAAQQSRAAGDRGRLHRQVAAMLAAYGRLHSRGVIHGDVHPGNCLVTDEGRVVILDFGNARWTSDPATVDPLRTGIPQFYDPQMAEALLAGRLTPAATVISEQYSIAVLAYVLLTGLQPIDAPGVHDELLRRIAIQPPLPFAARGVAGWPRVERVIAQALAKSPGERHPDVAAMASAFTAAGVAADAPPIDAARPMRAFAAAIDEALELAPSAASPDHIWFALRAALATERPELLAAADVLVSFGTDDWRTACLAASIARARSDRRGEDKAIASFLRAAARVSDPDEAATSIVAAAALLDGATWRAANATALSEWAARRLSELSKTGGEKRCESLELHAALALCKCGVGASDKSLVARLDRPQQARRGDVWLWSLAYEVFGEPRFAGRALAAKLPREPRLRAFALLRLYQLTGAEERAQEARAILSRGPGRHLSALDTALLVAELRAPEAAVLPPFVVPAALGRRRARRAAKAKPAAFSRAVRATLTTPAPGAGSAAVAG
jgi:predicted Ser/Thr protein kinase